MANPAAVGAAVAAGGAALFNEVRDVVEQFEDLNNRVANITNLTGQGLADQVVGVQTIAQVFDEEVNEVLIGSNNLVQAFGISYEESLNLIRTGLQSGANIQGDFLNQLNEFPQVIANAGFSADEFIRIINQQGQDGLFDDRLIDSIQEAGISLAEFTDTQADALERAIGSEAAQRIQEGLRTGALTARDAILTIGDAVIESGADVSELGTITADIFRGAGEQAGGFQQIITSVYTALETELEDLVDDTDAYIIRQNQLFDATEDLNTANNILSGQLAGLGTSFEGLGTRVRAFATESLSQFINFSQSVSRTLSENGIFGLSTAAITRNRAIIEAETQTATNQVIDGLEQEATARRDAEREAAIIARDSQRRTEEQIASQQQLSDLISNFDDQGLDELSAIINNDFQQGFEAAAAEARDFLDAIGQIEAVDLRADITTRLAAPDDPAQDIADTDFIGQRANRDIEAARNTISNEEMLQQTITDIQRREELERLQLQLNFLEQGSEARIQAERRISAIQAETSQTTTQRQQEQTAEISNTLLSESNRVLSGINELQNARTQAELAALDTQFSARLAAAEGNAGLTARIEQELADQREQIEREAFERNQRFALAQAAINGALAVTAILTVPDFTFGIASAIQIASALALTATQIAAIGAQTFHTGGIIGDDRVASRVTDSSLKPNEQIIKAKKGERVIVDTAFKRNEVQTITGTPDQIASALNHEIGGGIEFARGAHFGAVPTAPEYVQQGASIVRFGSQAATAAEIEQAMVKAVSQVQVFADVGLFQRSLNKMKFLEKRKRV